MKKRILSLIVSVCLMFTILPTAAFAASGTKYPPSDSGNPSWDVGFPYPNSVTATLIGTELTVTGTGKMKNFDGGIPAPWSEELIASVIIDNGVQSIGDKAFFNSYILSSVTIPASVRAIGDFAFGFESGRGEIPRDVTMYFKFDEEKSMSHTSFCGEDNINLEISNILGSTLDSWQGVGVTFADSKAASTRVTGITLITGGKNTIKPVSKPLIPPTPTPPTPTSSGTGGGQANDEKPALRIIDAKVAGSNDVRAQIEAAIKKAVEKKSKTALVNVFFVDYDILAPDGLTTLKKVTDELAKKNNIAIVLQLTFDQTSVTTVTSRITVNYDDLAKVLKGDLKLKVFTDPSLYNTVKVLSDRFKTSFGSNNVITTVVYDEAKPIGINASTIIKLNPAATNKKALKVFTYNSSSDTYNLIPNSQYKYDANGYIYFTSQFGGITVVVDSNSPVPKKSTAIS